MTWGRVSVLCYVESYPGVGLGVVAEWVTHHQGRGVGTLEMSVVVLCLMVRAELTVHPRPQAVGRR